MPPLYTIEMGKNAHKYFKKVDVRPDGKPIYQLKSMEEFMEVNIYFYYLSYIYFYYLFIYKLENIYHIY